MIFGCSICQSATQAEVDVPGRIVASLDRKRLGQTLGAERGSRPEAFSMRRLGGSRWRLRRTRCAMGFEGQSVTESKTGRVRPSWNRGVVIVESVACA